MPAGGEVEIPVAVDGRKRACIIHIDDIDLYADVLKRLLDERRKQRHVLAVHDRHQL